MVQDLENMVGVVCSTSHPSCKNFWRVTKLVWDLALSWWNTIPFLLNNSGLFCFSESFNLSSWWQNTSELIVVLADKSSKNKIPLKSQTESITFFWWISAFEVVWANSSFYSMISCISYWCKHPFLLPSDNSLQNWVILLTL